MPEERKPYQIEGGTEEYLRLVAVIEARWYNQPGTDKTWVEETVRASDEHFRNFRKNAVLVR